MALYEPDRFIAHAAMPDGRVVRAILRTFAGIAAWNDARISRKALNALSDRELDDVGLHRGAIERFVRR